MGTGPFAVPSFDALADSIHEVLAVVTRPLPPVKSRGGLPPTPVADWAEGLGLTLHRPASINDAEAIDELRSHQPDLLVVCDYGQILRPAALEVAPLGGINLHGSLLPAYRGAAPVQRSLLSGDTVTGVSVIHMTPRLDGGPILTDQRTEIRDDETAGELETRLAKVGVRATLNAIDMLCRWDGESQIGRVQDATLVSKAPRLSKAEGEIDWSMTTRLIDCHVRGMQPWPVAFTHFATNPNKPPVRIQIKSAKPHDMPRPADARPAQCLTHDGLLVVTGDGVLRIENLQPAGKKEMSGAAFVNGYQPSADAKFQ